MRSCPFSTVMSLSLALYVIAMTLYPIEIAFARKTVVPWRRGLLALGAALHAVGLFLFHCYSSHFLFAGADGASLFLGWVMVVSILALETRYHRSILGSLSLPIALLITLYACGCPAAAQRHSQSPDILWLSSHVVVTVVAYAFFTIAFCYDVLFLVGERLLKRKSGLSILRMFPSLHTAEAVVAYVSAAGLALLSAGILTGVVRAYSERSGFVMWQDRKIVLACVLWCAYAVYLCAHWVWGWRGRKGHLLNLAAYLLLLATLFSQHAIVSHS